MGGIKVLQELTIKDFAIIHDLSLSFEKGMTVLTGETGAGKSIIIDAVGLLAGGRGSSEFIRHGAERCRLEALFSIGVNSKLLEVLEYYDIETENREVVIQRDIHKSGRNSCRINGRLVTITILREIGQNLIDIHSQSENQELMNTDNHLRMLDQFGDDDLLQLKQGYQSYYTDYKQIKKKYTNWQSNEQELVQRIDMLQFQATEIESVELISGEEEKMKEEKTLLSNHQKIVESLSITYEALQGDEGNGIDYIGEAMAAIQSVDQYDEEYKRLAELISTSYFQLQEAASDVLKERDQLSYDEDRLNEIEKRLEVIHQLKRKYGESVEEVLDYYEEITVEIDELQNRETNLEELEKKLSALEKKVIESGKNLSVKRKKTAIVLEKAIQEQLKELYMDKVVFEVVFSKAEKQKISAAGLDQVEFYIAANPGEPAKPLTKVASGGELSRLMLALKTVFSKTQGMTSIIFDEVDTGVSGRVAQAIANKIYLVAFHSQVLCITHLPQVAATADQHLFISKKIVKDRTETHVKALSEKEKQAEVARMLAGTEITPLTLEHAKELKDMAKKEKKKLVANATVTL